MWTGEALAMQQQVINNGPTTSTLPDGGGGTSDISGILGTLVPPSLAQEGHPVTKFCVFVVSAIGSALAGPGRPAPCRAVPFGSVPAGFATAGSDADVCVLMDLACVPAPAGPSQVVSQTKARVIKILDAVAGAVPGGCEVARVYAARVPVLKVTSADGERQYDVVVNNTHGIANTALLRSYADQSRELRAAGVLLKAWLQRRGIPKSDAGGLSTYGWLLLLVGTALTQGVVQHVTPAGPESSTAPATTTVAPPLALDGVNGAATINLLRALFRDVKSSRPRTVHSLRAGRRVPLSRCSLAIPSCRGCPFTIEDPVETNRNVADVVTEEGADVILEEVRRASEVLEAGSGIGGLEDLLEVTGAGW